MKCQSCNADILWAKMGGGKPAPFDLLPHDDGNVRLVGDYAQVIGPMELKIALRNGERLHRSHFATCPDADKWRKP